jgi:hypothetical protein
MANVDVPLGRLRFGQTARKDAWWLQPLLTILGLGLGFGYLTWGLLQPDNYWAPPYLTPLASPLFYGEGPHAWFGPGKPGWWPAKLPLLPGLFIALFPGGFRFTCYYYRGTYYKAFWGDPPACAVGEPRHDYRGEHKFPLIIQNIHRYFLYVAVIFVGFLTYDLFQATQFPVAAGATETGFGLGVGTLLMAANVTLISCYTFSCHSFRHFIGGVLDVFSKSPMRKKAWDCVSCLNRRHGLWAWLSLASMCSTDLYIRLLASGVLTDWRIL